MPHIINCPFAPPNLKKLFAEEREVAANKRKAKQHAAVGCPVGTQEAEVEKHKIEAQQKRLK